MDMTRVVMLLACVLAATCTPTQDAPRATVQDTIAASRVILSDSAQNDTTIFEYDRVPGDSISDLDRFIVLGLRRIGHSRQDFINRLGPPDSSRARPFPNRHMPGQTDTVYNVHWQDVSAGFYHITNANRDMVTEVYVRDNRFLRLPTLRIGMPWHDVIARFGQPNYTDNAGYHFDCRACVVTQQTVLQVHDGRLSSIGFSYYLD